MKRSWFESLKNALWGIFGLMMYGIIVWIVWQDPDFIFHTNVLSLVLVLFLGGVSFTPWGKMPLGPRTHRMPWPRYLLSLLLLAFGVLLFTLAVFLAYVTGAPPGAVIQLDIPETVGILMTQQSVGWFFPTGFWVFLAFMFGLTAYSADKPATVKHWMMHYSPNIPSLKRALKYFGHYVSIRYAMLLFTFVMVASVLLMDFAICHATGHMPHVFYPSTTVMLFMPVIVLCLFTRSKGWSKWFHARWFSSLGWVMNLWVLFLALCLTLAFYSIDFMIATKSPAPNLGERMMVVMHERANVNVQAASFVWSLWIFTFPLVSNLILRVSVGRTLQEMFIAMVVMQLAFSTGLHSQVLLAIAHAFQYDIPLGLSILSLGLLGLLLWWVYGDTNARFLLQGMAIPHTPDVRASGYVRFLPDLVMFCAAMIMIHGLSGWTVIQFKVMFLSMEAVYLSGYMLLFMLIFGWRHRRGAC